MKLLASIILGFLLTVIIAPADCPAGESVYTHSVDYLIGVCKWCEADRKSGKINVQAGKENAPNFYIVTLSGMNHAKTIVNVSSPDRLISDKEFYGNESYEFQANGFEHPLTVNTIVECYDGGFLQKVNADIKIERKTF